MSAQKVEVRNCKFESFLGVCIERDLQLDYMSIEEHKEGQQESNILLEKCSFNKGDGALECRSTTACVTIKDCTISETADIALYFRKAKKVSISNTHISKCFRAVTFGKHVSGVRFVLLVWFSLVFVSPTFRQ